jgi:hypothetical protein
MRKNGKRMPQASAPPATNVRLSRRTKDLVAFTAALRRTSQSQILDAAVEEFLRTHSDEFEQKFAEAHKLLIAGKGMRGLVANQLGFSEERLNELGV